MSKNLKKVSVIGHFGFGETLLNGQTVKTKIVTRELEKAFGEDEVCKVDTHGGKKMLLTLPFTLFGSLKRSKNIVILPAHNGLRLIAPLLALENVFFHRGLHYAVIGGWLPEYLKGKRIVGRSLKRFHGIYVETEAMKRALEEQGYKNVTVMPNCKELNVLSRDELTFDCGEPYRLCTFSRVMKEKGIEDAVSAVRGINERSGRTVFTLDIYGQVDSAQTEWFEKLRMELPEYVRYGGLVPFDKSVEVLKDYFALLFPTYYEGEGFAGTVIDAYAAGVPVVASDWRYNAETVADGRTGLIFETHNVEMLMDRLGYLMRNPDEWMAMKLNCISQGEAYQPENVIKVLTEGLD